MISKKGIPISKMLYNFSTNEDILNMFVLFYVEFNCIPVSTSIHENT